MQKMSGNLFNGGPFFFIRIINGSYDMSFIIIQGIGIGRVLAGTQDCLGLILSMLALPTAGMQIASLGTTMAMSDP